ncbi:MGMT family protein [Candidatus Falkowbacteria bacterium]|nr:MGMT family protein [Candidatus Falkowbacteria bacterium]
MSDFKRNVLTIVRAIPKGSVMSYKEVAVAAGSPRAYRAVGTIMRNNKDKTVPCHRVITSSGSMGVYNGLKGGSKQRILQEEGHFGP